MILSMSPIALYRRIAALALLALLAAIFYLAVISPLVVRYQETRSAHAQLRMALERYRHAAAVLPSLKAELIALQAHQPSKSGYLAGENETIAAAELQHRVKAAVFRAGGDLRTIEILAPQREGQIQKIALRAQLEIGLAGLQRLLFALNETGPFLFFDDLDIRRREKDTRAGHPSARSLGVQIDVYGYLRSDK